MHVKHSPDTQKPDRPNPQGEQPKDAGTWEGEIDQILADSFPASDAPPWTLGVPSPRPERRSKKKGRGV
jgi:hypothetical protein